MSLFSTKPRKTYIDKNGYLRFKGSNKLVHRWVMEKKLGAPIPDGYVVHHKNGHKLDNRSSNLRLMTKEDHRRYHLGCLFFIIGSISLLLLTFLLTNL
jgi:HNH endonuclease